MLLIKVTFKWIVSNFFWKFGNGRDEDNGYFSKTQNIYNWKMSNLWTCTYVMWYSSNGRDSILCNYCIFKMTYYNVLETSRGRSRLTLLKENVEKCVSTRYMKTHLPITSCYSHSCWLQRKLLAYIIVKWNILKWQCN